MKHLDRFVKGIKILVICSAIIIAIFTAIILFCYLPILAGVFMMVVLSYLIGWDIEVDNRSK